MKNRNAFPKALLLALAMAANVSAQGIFTEITDPTNALAVYPNLPATYKGHTWVDFDGDNWTDIFASPHFLFKNLGNGKFKRLPDVAPGLGGQGAQGASMADVDNDGNPDLLTAQQTCNLFLMNDTFGFESATNRLPNIANYPAWDCALADANANGRLDLLFVHANGFHTPAGLPCKFFLQNAAGGFEPSTGHEFTDVAHPYTIPTWSDYDLDGDLDLFIGSGPAQNGAKPDYNYKNLLKETGTFQLQLLTEQHWASNQDGQVYNFVDTDLDGDLDVCLTNYSQAQTRFYQNNNGTYQSKNTTFTVIGQHLANCWGDLDHDGDEDAIITRDAGNTVLFYRNNGNGTFAVAKTLGTVATGTTTSGAAFADFDNDGDLDVFVNGPGEGRALFRNDTVAGGRNWAQFSLQGTASNRSAIGARLWLKATINGSAKWLTREVQAHNSFQSQNDLRQHFGLAAAQVVDSLRVNWPSGLVQRFAGLAPNRFYKLVEGQPIVEIVAAPEPTAAGPALEIWPNPFDNFVSVKTPGDFKVQISRLELFDSTGRLVVAQSVDNQKDARINLPAGLAAGAYFLTCHFADGSTSTAPLTRK